MATTLVRHVEGAEELVFQYGTAVCDGVTSKNPGTASISSPAFPTFIEFRKSGPGGRFIPRSGSFARAGAWCSGSRRGKALPADPISERPHALRHCDRRT